MMLRSLQKVGLVLSSLVAIAVAAPSAEILTNAADVLSLTAEQARRAITVSITGVVTVAESTPNWKGKFFVQDSTGGVFVNNTNKIQPVVGDLVHVQGASHVGGYAPDITRPIWTKIGTAPLPEARPVSGERLMSGAEDGQRVEVSGVVRSAQKGATRSSPGREYEFIEFESPVDIHEVQTFINFYKGECPGVAHGEVRIEFDSRIYGGQIIIPPYKEIPVAPVVTKMNSGRRFQSGNC